jgi:hypothetical protein
MIFVNCVILLQRAWRKKTVQQKELCNTFLSIRVRRECDSCGIFTLNKNHMCYECNYYFRYS